MSGRSPLFVKHARTLVTIPCEFTSRRGLAVAEQPAFWQAQAEDGHFRRARIALDCIERAGLLHAYSMTHFSSSERRTDRPERLTWFEKAKVLLVGVQVPRPENRTTPAALALPFTVQRFRGKDDIVYEGWHIPRARRKGLAILFHGYASSKSSLLPEAKVFHELGYETFLVDFRGSGGSTGRKTTLGFREAEDVAAAVSFARANLNPEPPVLYGQSMGAVAVLRAVAKEGVRSKAVILQAPFDHLLSAVRNRFGAMGVPSFPGAELLVFWGGVQHGYSGRGHSSVDYARALRCPALFLHGSDDTRVTTAQARSIYENVAGATKEFVAFNGVAHESCVARDPEKWKARVEAFLDQNP